MSGLEASTVSFPGTETMHSDAAPMLSTGLMASDGLMTPDGLMTSDGLRLFIGLAVAAASLVPLLAAGLRRGLPTGRCAPQPLEPVCFGTSQKVRRSPRHAILQHRGLIGTFFMALVALWLLPAVASLRALGGAVIPAALAFVLPTLLVTIHARRRSTRQ